MKASEFCQRALRTINAYGQADVAAPNDLQLAFDTANEMLDGWAAIRLTIFQNLQYTYPIVANKGGPSNPYTIGVGGDFNQVRPLWIPNANLLVTNSSIPYEVPLDILEQGEYARIPQKTLPSTLATALYYNGRFDSSGAHVGLGDIFLYPVPNGGLPCQLVFYTPVPLTEFADLETTDYFFPPGYKEALRWQLALRLCDPFGKPLTQTILTMAAQTFGVIQRPNVHMPRLVSDLESFSRHTGLYDWRTGSSSRRGLYS